MRVLINVNEQISATMIEKHFQASSLEAEVTAAPIDMMLEIMRACKIDLVAYYSEDVDNVALISLFNAAGDNRKILFVKKQNLGLVSQVLEGMLDECFTIPLDSNELMIRLRRMFRQSEQKCSLPQTPPTQEIKPAEPVSQQPVQYTPPVQSIWPPQVFIRPEITYQPQITSSEPEPESETIPAYRELYTAPINTGYPNVPESVQPETTYRINPEPAAPPIYKVEGKNVKIKKEKKEKIKKEKITKEKTTAANDGTVKGKKKKNKSPLRYLNKTELLEIILEQEKMLNDLNQENAEIKQKLDDRNIIMEEAGSIAEAALKLNGVFEAAQKSAEQYVESVKRKSI